MKVGESYYDRTHYQNPKIDLLIEKYSWREILKVLSQDEKRDFRVYLHHRKGELTDFWVGSIPKMEAIASKLLKWEEKRANTRWVVKDTITGKYWSAIANPPYWRSIRRAFLFMPGDRYIEELVKRSNRTQYKENGHLGRFEIIDYDATKRINKSPF